MLKDSLREGVRRGDGEINQNHRREKRLKVELKYRTLGR